jgi:DNA-binding PadR family transcriptional regulator
MIGKDLEITPTQALFLIALQDAEINPDKDGSAEQGSQSLSGSEIVEKITVELGEEWKPSAGATYKIVQALETKGYIQETTEEENRKDQRKRTYSLTSEGREMVTKVALRAGKLFYFMASCCPEQTKAFMVVKKADNDPNCEC